MKRKILFIDDDRDFVAMVKLILETKGFDVVTAGSGEEAFKILDGKYLPDAMILDVMMAGRADGIIFARRIRKQDAYRDVPILMLTGMRQATGFGPMKADPTDPVFLPVDVFLEKPVLPETLLSKIEGMLAAKTRQAG